MVVNRTLQWVIGISAGVIALAVLLAVVTPWVAPWVHGPLGVGMMGNGYRTTGSGYGMMGNGRGMMGNGYRMMAGPGSSGWGGTGNRISIDQARTAAEEYVTAVNSGLAVVEVMEFENNFYALVTETQSGRGAFELLVDPYTGSVGPEPGPNMMWNDRYGHMSFGGGGENRVTLDEARAFAQQELDSQLPGSTVHQDGASFYGYYTFDFDSPDGSIAGMLSVEGSSGAVWVHTWHGGFLSEWEAEKMSS
jgi:hypothetical protein